MNTQPTPKRQTWISGSPASVLSFLVTLGYLDPGPDNVQPASYEDIAQAKALLGKESGPLRNCFRLDTSQATRHVIAFRGATSSVILKQLSMGFPDLQFERLGPAWSVADPARRRDANEPVPAPFTEYQAWRDGLRIRSAIYSGDLQQPPLRYESACAGRIVVLTEDPRELDCWLINHAYLYSADWDGHPYWPLVVDITPYAADWMESVGESQFLGALGPFVERKAANTVTITAMRRPGPCVVELDVETLGLPPSEFAKALQKWFPAHSRVGYFETSLVEWRLRFWEADEDVTLRRNPDQHETRTDLWLTLTSRADTSGDPAANRKMAFDALYAEAHLVDKLLGVHEANDEAAGDWLDLEHGILTKWLGDTDKGDDGIMCVRRISLSPSDALAEMKDQLSRWVGRSELAVTISRENGRYFAIEHFLPSTGPA